MIREIRKDSTITYKVSWEHIKAPKLTRKLAECLAFMHLSEQLAGEIGYSSIFYLITLWSNLMSYGFFPLFHYELSSGLSRIRCLRKKESAISIIGASLHISGSKTQKYFCLQKSMEGKYRMNLQLKSLWHLFPCLSILIVSKYTIGKTGIRP